MATSGSCETDRYNSKKWINCSWNRTGYTSDSSHCYSTIHFKLTGGGTDNAYHYTGPVNIWVYHTNGTLATSKTYLNTRVKLYNGDYIGEFDVNINHKTSGEGSFRVYIEAAIYTNAVNCYADKTWTLDSLPRQATISRCDNFKSNVNPTMKFSNPGGLSCVLRLEFGDNFSQKITKNSNYTGAGGEYTFSLTDQERQTLYAACPSSKTLTVRYVVATKVNGTEVWWSYYDRTMTVVDYTPNFSTFTYKDIGDGNGGGSLALTGNNQIAIKNYNCMRVVISTANKATSVNGSPIVKYRAVCGKLSDEKDYSSNSEVVLSLNYIIEKTIDVYAIDARGYSKKVSLTISDSNWKTYVDPKVSNIYVFRTNSIGTQTSLSIAGTFWNSSFGSVTNTFNNFRYRYKKTTTSTWSSYVNITPTKSGNNFSFSARINGDESTASNGFNKDYSYNIQVQIKDKIKTLTYDLILNAGAPLMAMHRRGIAFGAPYDDTKNGVMQVHGLMYLTDSALLERSVANENVYYDAKRADTGTQVRFGVGSGGINHGIWSSVHNKWLLYADNDNIYLNGKNINTFMYDVLYNNSSGTTGTVTLSSSSANYSRLVIFYGCDGVECSTEISSPNGKIISLNTNYVIGDRNDHRMLLYIRLCSISGTTITSSNSRNNCITGDSTVVAYSNDDYVKIFKVLGYK